MIAMRCVVAASARNSRKFAIWWFKPLHGAFLYARNRCSSGRPATRSTEPPTSFVDTMKLVEESSITTPRSCTARAMDVAHGPPRVVMGLVGVYAFGAATNITGVRRATKPAIRVEVRRVKSTIF